MAKTIEICSSYTKNRLAARVRSMREEGYPHQDRMGVTRLGLDGVPPRPYRYWMAYLPSPLPPNRNWVALGQVMPRAVSSRRTFLFTSLHLSCNTLGIENGVFIVSFITELNQTKKTTLQGVSCSWLIFLLIGTQTHPKTYHGGLMCAHNNATKVLALSML